MVEGAHRVEGHRQVGGVVVGERHTLLRHRQVAHHQAVLREPLVEQGFPVVVVLQTLGEGVAVFENAEHDDPQRIRYERTDKGVTATISGLTISNGNAGTGDGGGILNNGTLTITLGGTKEGTHLVFDYVVGGYSRFKLEEIAPAVDKVLGEQLTRLVDAAQAPPADAPTPPAQAK